MRSAPHRILIPVFLVLALAACQPDEEKLAEHLSRADAFAEEEQWAEAIIEYKNVLQIDPNHGAAHFGLSQAFLKNKQLREAFWELRETVRLDSSNLLAKLQFGQISIYAGELEEALKQAEEVIEADSTKIDAYLLKGHVLDMLKRRDEALEAFRAALEVGPENRYALINLANFLRRQNPDEAEPLYRKLVELFPITHSYTLLASFLNQERGQLDDAEAAYRKAVEVAEDAEQSAGAYVRLAGFLFNRDHHDEAVETLKSAIANAQEKEEDSLDLIYLLARFYGSQGEREKADALIEGATEASPDDPRPYLILSSYRGRKGDLEGALEAARKAWELDPENAQAKLRTAEVLVESGHENDSKEQLAEGRSIIEAVLAGEPSNPGALFVKGKIELADGDIESAITALRAAIDVRPDWAPPHFVLGAALAMQGDRTAARSELARSLEIDAGLLEAHKVLAQVHAGLREHEYAVDAGRRYLRERPGDTDTRILVAQSLVRLGKLDEALQELGAIREKQRDARVRYAFGRVYLSQGEYDKAREALTQADRERPNSPDILRSLFQLDRIQNRLADSVERVAAAVQADPENARLHRLRGMVALEGRRVSDAERSFNKAVELDPDDLANYEQLARFYGAVGRTAEMIETYKKALEVRPQAGSIHYFLGVLYEMEGKTDLAIERYGDAIRYAPQLAEPKNNLAYLLAETGENLDRALDLAQEAKAMLPDSANAADTLGWVLLKRGIPSAAISYLREAEAATGPGDASLGVIRHHLALAYQANGELAPARQVLERALEDFAAQVQAMREQGRAPGADPEWAIEARAMLERLKDTPGSVAEEG